MAGAHSGNVTGWRLLGFCALYTLALNSKEMAAGNAAILLAYELIYHWPTGCRCPGAGYGTGEAIWIAVAMTMLATKFRMSRQVFVQRESISTGSTLSLPLNTSAPLLLLISQLFFLQEDALNFLGGDGGIGGCSGRYALWSLK